MLHWNSSNFYKFNLMHALTFVKTWPTSFSGLTLPLVLERQISMTQELSPPPGVNVCECVEVWCLQTWLYRWRGGRTERSQRTWRRCSVWLRLAGSSQSVCRFPVPTCRAREFTLWGDILKSCMPVTRKTRKKQGFPSSQGNHDMKCWSCQGPETKREEKKKKPGHVWKLLSFVHVSHGIPEFWSHPVGHFEGIFFSLPSQSNLNNFHLHILTLNPSLMSYLCDYVSLLAKKQPVCTDCQPLVALSSFFLSSLRTVGTVFNFEGGIKANSLMLHFK